MKAIFDARTLSHHDRAEMRRIFDLWIKQSDRSQLRLRIPKEVKPVHNLGGMHYHYRPEIFLQIAGRTEFRFPREHFAVMPGELCVVPAGVPQAERVYAEPTQPFRNLVAGFYNNTISLHFAHEASPQHPDIEAIAFF